MLKLKTSIYEQTYIMVFVRLSLFVESTSYLAVFFFHNKSANNTFSLSAIAF